MACAPRPRANLPARHGPTACQNAALCPPTPRTAHADGSPPLSRPCATRPPDRPHRRLRQRPDACGATSPTAAPGRRSPNPPARLRPRGPPGRGRPDRGVHARGVRPGSGPRRQHAGARHADHPRRPRRGDATTPGWTGQVPRHRSGHAGRPVVPLRGQAGEHPRPGAAQDAGLRQPDAALLPGAEGRPGRPDPAAVGGLRPGAVPLRRHRAVQHRDQDRLRRHPVGVRPPASSTSRCSPRTSAGPGWARG